MVHNSLFYDIKVIKYSHLAFHYRFSKISKYFSQVDGSSGINKLSESNDMLKDFIRVINSNSCSELKSPFKNFKSLSVLLFCVIGKLPVELTTLDGYYRSFFLLCRIGFKFLKW